MIVYLLPLFIGASLAAYCSLRLLVDEATGAAILGTNNQTGTEEYRFYMYCETTATWLWRRGTVVVCSDCWSTADYFARSEPVLEELLRYETEIVDRHIRVGAIALLLCIPILYVAVNVFHMAMPFWERVFVNSILAVGVLFCAATLFGVLK